MSKIKPQQPIIHIPRFTEYGVDYIALRSLMVNGIGLEIPMSMHDTFYYYVSLEDWGKILRDLVFSSSLYKRDKFDCEDYAMKAWVVCRERYGINTLGVVHGDTDLGHHAFNILYYGDGFMLFEPNEGFPFSGSAFDIGEYGYKPELVLI